eukprot:scaffold7694_cov116-Isochrysis_galbana.AAC.4
MHSTWTDPRVCDLGSSVWSSPDEGGGARSIAAARGNAPNSRPRFGCASCSWDLGRGREAYVPKESPRTRWVVGGETGRGGVCARSGWDRRSWGCVGSLSRAKCTHPRCLNPTIPPPST